jgi:hypothetical protein
MHILKKILSSIISNGRTNDTCTDNRSNWPKGNQCGS